MLPPTEPKDVIAGGAVADPRTVKDGVRAGTLLLHKPDRPKPTAGQANVAQQTSGVGCAHRTGGAGRIASASGAGCTMHCA